MQQRLINRSADLKRLRDEGYDLEIRSGYLLVKDVPYVNSGREVKRGIFVSKLVLAGEVTSRPDNHIGYLAGEYPCHADGSPIEQIRNSSNTQLLAEGVQVNHLFSAKPKPADAYDDYYAKVTTYVAILSGPAQAIDPSVTAKTFAVSVTSEDDTETVFNYTDTASSRAEIGMVAEKLALGKVAIIGLGGTGSYILDLVTKTPVKEIHLFDGDDFLQHNAFRSPGAPSIEDLQAKPLKSSYFKNLYSKMHRGIIDHGAYVSFDNINRLQRMDFVFLCVDSGGAKRLIIEKLEEFGLPFLDVGMGISLVDNALGGIVRVTKSTSSERGHFRSRVSLADNEHPNEYGNNIQIADLNALNAALAVIAWKKHFGFYRDLEFEHHSTYTIDGNIILNEDLRL